MTIRRTFKTPDNVEMYQGQVLVTYDAASDTMRVAWREDTWDTWSRPFDEVPDSRQDDEPGPRSYGEDGRTFTVD